MFNPRGLFVTLVAGLALLSGCAQPAQQQAAEPPPPVAELKVNQVDQVSAVDTRKADGQFVVVKLSFKNVSKADILLSGGDIKVKYLANDEKEDQYSQGMEGGLMQQFSNAYGPEAKEQLIDPTSQITVHPDLSLERYAIFQLPKDARLEDFAVVYTPPAAAAGMFDSGPAPAKPSVEVKLQDADTVVNDKRDL